MTSELVELREADLGQARRGRGSLHWLSGPRASSLRLHQETRRRHRTLGGLSENQSCLDHGALFRKFENAEHRRHACRCVAFGQIHLANIPCHVFDIDRRDCESNPYVIQFFFAVRCLGVVGAPVLPRPTTATSLFVQLSSQEFSQERKKSP